MPACIGSDVIVSDAEVECMSDSAAAPTRHSGRSAVKLESVLTNIIGTRAHLLEAGEHVLVYSRIPAGVPVYWLSVSVGVTSVQHVDELCSCAY